MDTERRLGEWKNTVAKDVLHRISSGNGPSRAAVFPRMANLTNALALFYAVCTATRSILVTPAQILQVRPASTGGDGPDGLWRTLAINKFANLFTLSCTSYWTSLAPVRECSVCMRMHRIISSIASSVSCCCCAGTWRDEVI